MAKMTDADVVAWILACRDEAEEAKRDRMDTNKDNFDSYHLRHDFSHKEEGQSQEILSKVSVAVEQTRSFFQQALANLGDWWRAEAMFPGTEQSMAIRPEEITKLTNYMLERAKYFNHVGNEVQMALLGSLAVSKVRGELVDKPYFVARRKGRGKSLKRWVDKVENKTWRLVFDEVRHENFYPDPNGTDLYIVEDSWLDLFEVKKLAEGDEAIYNAEAVNGLGRGDADAEQETDKARETGQNVTIAGMRPKVKITELWGTFLNRDGEVCYENHVATIANDTILIRKPEMNPRWSQKRPYVFSPLIEVSGSVWHKAVMDAPVKHNKSMIELYNLIVDGSMQATNAIKQVRKDWLDNVAQISDGIKYGKTLTVNSMAPPGAKVLEPLTSVQVPPEAFNALGLQQSEFNSSAFTNDARMQGGNPNVSATATVESSNAINNVFQGMAKNFESSQIMPELEQAWETVAQNWDMISEEEFVALFGPDRGRELKAIPAEEVFALTVGGVKFRVYGVSLTLARAQEFQRLTQLLQVVSSSPQLLEEFMKKYDLGKTLGEIMSALNIDKYKLEIPAAVAATMAPDGGAPVEGQPDQNSQTPQAGTESMAAMMGAGGPQPVQEFPGSPALAGG